MLRRQQIDEEEKNTTSVDDDDDDEDDDVEERMSFLDRNQQQPPSAFSSSSFEIRSGNTQDTSTAIQQHRRSPLLIVFVGLLCGIPILFLVSNSGLLSSHNSRSAASSSSASAASISYTCPIIPTITDINFIGYEAVSKAITTDKEEFLKSFHTTTYDDWGKTYDAVKKAMQPFKLKYYPQYLKSDHGNGSKTTTKKTMYESACGIGLNLYMTLELLHEYDPTIRDITVYGNDYVQASTTKANTVVLADDVIPSGNTKGIICPGDSLHLTHVPSNAFDLVFTGYLTPLEDPLEFGELSDDWWEYKQICKTLDKKNTKNKNHNKNKNKNKEKHKNDWMGQKLQSIAEQRQRDWYGNWVSEMARIAKPGVPVIIEQISVPYCTVMVRSHRRSCTRVVLYSSIWWLFYPRISYYISMFVLFICMVWNLFIVGTTCKLTIMALRFLIFFIY